MEGRTVFTPVHTLFSGIDFWHFPDPVAFSAFRGLWSEADVYRIVGVVNGGRTGIRLLPALRKLCGFRSMERVWLPYTVNDQKLFSGMYPARAVKVLFLPAILVLPALARRTFRPRLFCADSKPGCRG